MLYLWNILFSQKITKEKENSVPITEEFVSFLIKFVRRKKRVYGFHFSSLRGADAFSHSAPVSPLWAAAAQPQRQRESSRPGRQGRAVPARPRRTKAHIEPGWQSCAGNAFAAGLRSRDSGAAPAALRRWARPGSRAALGRQRGGGVGREERVLLPRLAVPGKCWEGSSHPLHSLLHTKNPQQGTCRCPCA